MPTVDDDHLERILDRVQEWTRAADTKSEILGLMQTASAALLAENLEEWFAPDTRAILRVGMGLAVALWGVSVTMTALAILANTKNPHRTSVTFFGDIANVERWKDIEA